MTISRVVWAEFLKKKLYRIISATSKSFRFYCCYAHLHNVLVLLQQAKISASINVIVYKNADVFRLYDICIDPQNTVLCRFLFYYRYRDPYILSMRYTQCCFALDVVKKRSAFVACAYQFCLRSCSFNLKGSTMMAPKLWMQLFVTAIPLR